MPVQTDWIAEANCTGSDPELFFPEVGATYQFEKVQRMFCHPCPVRSECLEYALGIESSAAQMHTYGIYGGLAPKARKQIRKQRGYPTPPPVRRP